MLYQTILIRPTSFISLTMSESSDTINTTRDSLIPAYQATSTAPGPNRDPHDSQSPLVTDPIATFTTGKRVWHSVTPRATSIIAINAGVSGTTFQQFQAMVAEQCNDQHADTAAIINRSITSGRPQIKLAVGIPRVNLSRTTRPRWITTLRTANQTEAQLFLSMPSPKDFTKRAFTEDILGQQALRGAASAPSGPRRLSQSPSPSRRRGLTDLEANELASINYHMNKIYSIHQANALYDCQHPVYLDPLDTKHYILLMRVNLLVGPAPGKVLSSSFRDKTGPS
ncbi:hypothetical protein MJO28_014709 [Puccinia striiformis f. sp. tritici]|uniref:Uncharacterized protein n=1 Tax=Puccinia striiformis f. sp. tritici TaxID=168172 RepID=A0ACC0DUP2_9BASI|nr:hypothetical protein MJO28_014709 [Puccinia striiformis f. sp. tritici]